MKPLEKKWKWKDKWKISVQDKEWGMQDWTTTKVNIYIIPPSSLQKHGGKKGADYFVVYSEAWTRMLWGGKSCRKYPSCYAS